jgi:hypothetical protein
MAHYAKVEDGVVTQVIVAHSKLWCEEILGGTWVQTSYNTQGGVHLLGGQPLRKNYAGIGYSYDETKDAFIAPQPYPSWVLNEDTCLWEAPIAYPTDNLMYEWNEETENWQARVMEITE